MNPHAKFAPTMNLTPSPLRLLGFVFIVLGTGCADDEVCSPGATAECLCLNGSKRAQVCSASGDHWGECNCEADTPDAGMQAGEYIVGGELSREFAATGALTRDGAAFCTATLVARNLALTAAHCVDKLVASPTSIYLVLGTEPNRPSARSNVAGITLNPLWNGGFMNGSDLAVLRLETSIDDVKPAVPYAGNATALVGSNLTLVGYGASASPRCDGAGVGAGVRRQERVQVSKVTAQAIEYTFMGGGACNGDSGGPAFLNTANGWRQVGVTSFGDQCCVQYGAYQRLDVHQAWLARQGVPFTDRVPVCAADGVCDGQCPSDEDCSNLLCPNGSCTAPSACAADEKCEQECGSVDVDCRSTGEAVDDPCRVYRLYENGQCDPQCPADPECSARPPSACIPVQADSFGNCIYRDSSNAVCRTSPLQNVLYDGARRACVYFDGYGTACAMQPATPLFDPAAGICSYVDPRGALCGQLGAWCNGFSCGC